MICSCCFSPAPLNAPHKSDLLCLQKSNLVSLIHWHVDYGGHSVDASNVCGEFASLNQNAHFYDAMVSFEVQIVSIIAIEIQWINPMLSYMDGWSEARSP